MRSENYKIIYVLNKIADMVIISALWCVCCLPVITVGASTAALYHSVVKSIREDRAYAAPSFWAAFRANLKQCIGFSTGAIGCMLVFGCTIYGIYQYLGNFWANVYLVFSVICFCIVVTVQIHAYFLIGRFEIKGRNFWSVLLKLSGNGLGKNLIILAVLIFAIELILYYPLVILFVPAGFVYLISFIEEKQFEKYIRI